MSIAAVRDLDNHCQELKSPSQLRRQRMQMRASAGANQEDRYGSRIAGRTCFLKPLSEKRKTGYIDLFCRAAALTKLASTKAVCGRGLSICLRQRSQ